MIFALFGNVDLKPAFEQLKILEVSKMCMLETGKYENKSKNGLLPTLIGNWFEDPSTQEIQFSSDICTTP